MNLDHNGIANYSQWRGKRYVELKDSESTFNDKVQEIIDDQVAMKGERAQN
jgi:hypothetical protein